MYLKYLETTLQELLRRLFSRYCSNLPTPTFYWYVTAIRNSSERASKKGKLRRQQRVPCEKSVTGETWIRDSEDRLGPYLFKRECTRLEAREVWAPFPLSLRALLSNELREGPTQAATLVPWLYQAILVLSAAPFESHSLIDQCCI